MGGVTVFSLVIPLFLAVLGIRVIRFTPFPVRFVFGFSFFLATVGAGYLFTEFVVNKGPDDWGSLWHAGYPLSAQYGKWQGFSYELQSFDKDTDGSGSGTYHVRFRYNGRRGLIFCHYDKASGKFDRDEIVPDK